MSEFDTLSVLLGVGLGATCGYLIGSYAKHRHQEKIQDKVKSSKEEYVLHFVKNEKDAIDKITQAYSSLGIQPPDSLAFEKNGDLVEKIETSGWFGRPKSTKEINKHITLLRYMDTDALQINILGSIRGPERFHTEAKMIHEYLSSLK